MPKLNNKEWVAVSIAIAVVLTIVIGPIVYGQLFDKKGNMDLNLTNVDTGNDQRKVNGLKITDITQGTGKEARDGVSVTVHYVGKFEDGRKFDSSIDRGIPFTFTLGQGTVIKGWDMGLIGMKEGGKRSLVIPPEMGYGANSVGPIPGNSILYFEVQLLSVK